MTESPLFYKGIKCNKERNEIMRKRPYAIIQIVGYKNAGKTTLMSELISYLTQKDYRVASLKHHGHNSLLQTPENTDTHQHMQSGAVMTGIQSSAEVQFHLQSGDLSMKQILDIYTIMDLDILLLEGFKQEPYPKIVLLRGQEDKSLLGLSNIIAAGVMNSKIQVMDYPVFSMDDMEQAVPQLAGLCLARMQKREKK